MVSPQSRHPCQLYGKDAPVKMYKQSEKTADELLV